MSEEALQQWEQRLAAGRLLLGQPAPPPLATAAPAFVLGAPTATPVPQENMELEGPHVFEDEESDSEVFSDLEF
jgi:hypothetical protein